jgi:type II secretory pathway pseudopilin PulG
MTRRREDSAFTVVEMAIGLAITAVVMATLVAVFHSFSQNAADATRTAELNQTLRGIASQMVLDLRQAEAPRPDGEPIESLSPTRIVFVTDRDESEGPERVVYEEVSCGADGCALRVQRYAAVAGTGPSWEFSDTPYQDGVVVEKVQLEEPLFVGYDWVGSPAVKTAVTECGGASEPDCDFPLVAIRLVALPDLVSEGAENPVEIVEEVTLRNAS